ncbi:MAG: alpha/beta fold hydrolase [Desulfovibrionales bacterium]
MIGKQTQKTQQTLQSKGSVIQLHDGREIGCFEAGDPKGEPVFYFHGCPGSRLEVLLTEPISRDLHLRFIGLDRPGYGKSTNLPGRRLMDWPRDVQEVAENLGLDTFHLLGISGGGPFALACAHAIPERLRTVSLVGSIAPSERTTLRKVWLPIRTFMMTARGCPKGSDALLAVLSRIVRCHPRAAIALMSWVTPAPANKAVLTDPEIRTVLAASLGESIRQGAQGIATDLCLYVQEWGFDLQDIRIPVIIWQGRRDVTVPEEMGRQLQRTIPKSSAYFLPEEGHFSVPLARMDRILSRIVQNESLGD